MIYVGGQGNPKAKLMIVGEAPGKNEENLGYPFAGATGKIVDDLLKGANLNRADLYLTNVVKVRPPDNKLMRLKEIGKSIDDFLPQLWEEIKVINPNCILAIGDLALKTLTGNTGIKKWRGSILSSLNGYPKVVSTIHPASILHSEESSGGMMSWKDLVYIQEDFKRAAEESLTRELRLPDRNLHIARNSLDLCRYLDRYAESNLVTIDIEAYKTIPTCISLAFNRYESCSVPLIQMDNSFPIMMHDLVPMWRLLTDFFNQKNLRINGQNLKYDIVKLKDQCKLKLPSPYFDVMLAFHTLYPEMPKKLSFIQSLLTREPYHKDEYAEFNPKTDKVDRIYLYNAKDSAVTHECYEVLIEDLKNENMSEFFFQHVMPLHNLYMNLEEVGLLVDLNARKMLHKKYDEWGKKNDEELTKLCGNPLNVNSPKQVAMLLYGELKLPTRKDVGEETLMGLMNNVVKNETHKSILRLILNTRKIKKCNSTYVGASICKDGRLRTQYFITGTETGRSSTQKLKPPVSLEPEGIPFHNLTKHGDTVSGEKIGKDIRKMLIPDPGFVFVECDKSQCQARIVAMLADDKEALFLFSAFDRTGLPQFDIHRVTASWILGIDPLIVTKDQRQFGKPIRHAGNFAMGKGRLSIMADISQYRAGKVLDIFHEKSPNIRKVFHKEIQECLMKDRSLTDPYDAKRTFADKMGDELFKEAYAHLPQRIEINSLRKAMMCIKREMPEVIFVIEAHDSFTALIRISAIDRYCRIAKKHMEEPIDFKKCSLSRGLLIIPAEFQIGKNNLQEMEAYHVN